MSELLYDSGMAAGGYAVARDSSPNDRLAATPRGFFPDGYFGEYADDEPTPFDLRRLIDTVTDDLRQRRIAKGLKLEVRYSLDAPRRLIGHRSRIRQVMMKLIGRAVELAALLRRSSGKSSRVKSALMASSPGLSGEAPAVDDPHRVVVDVQGDVCADGCAAMRLRVEVSGWGVCARTLMGAEAGPAVWQPNQLRALPGPAKAFLGSLRPDGPGPLSTLADCRRLVELMGGRLGTLTDSGSGSFVWLVMKLPIDASRPQV